MSNTPCPMPQVTGVTQSPKKGKEKISQKSLARQALTIPGKAPLRAILVVPFVLQIFAAVGLTGWLSLRNGQEAINEVTVQLRGEIGARIEEKLRSYLEAPRIIARINTDGIELGHLNPQETASLTRQFWRQRFLFESANVSAMYFGGENAEFIGLGFQENQRWEIGRAGKSAESFNLMAEQLQESFDALERTNIELEERVVLRTAALSGYSREDVIGKSAVEVQIWANLEDRDRLMKMLQEEGKVRHQEYEFRMKSSAKVSALELVCLLNQIFSYFDRLTEIHGLEKIKTIGDAYMVAGGLPVPREDCAIAIANMALDMQEAIANFNREQKEQFQIRIGINTGPVVAGVIGTKKFIYDLWGDTVNVASRMESSGKPGKIQVSAATYELLKTQFILETRGEINVKGKGKMMAYWLTGRSSIPLRNPVFSKNRVSEIPK